MTAHTPRDDPTPSGPAAHGDAGPESHDTQLAPEFRAARSLTDRSKAEDLAAEDDQLPPTPAHRPRVWPRVLGVLILLLGVGGAWIWQNPGSVRDAVASLFPGAATDATTIRTLEIGVARLEQRPAAADLGPLTRRLDALENRGQATAQTPPSDATARPVDLGSLLARLDALETRVRQAPPAGAAQATPVGAAEPDLRPLLARLDRMEKALADRGATQDKIDALAARVDGLSSPAADLRARLDGVDQKLTGLAANGAKLAEGSDQAMRLARLEAAATALAAGRALGPIPDAPPALTKFATTAPPTEAALRLAFPAAAQSALLVSRPDTEGKPFLDRILARLKDVRLITVRDGDKVLIGDPASSVLARARLLLDAGDLAGAVGAVAALSGPPAEKMAAWRADAASLVAAREALLSLAGDG